MVQPAKSPAPVVTRFRVELALIPGEKAPHVQMQGSQALLIPGQKYTVRVGLIPAEGDSGAQDIPDTVLLSVAWRGPEGVTVQTNSARVFPSELSAPIHRDFRLETMLGAKDVQGQLVLVRTDTRGALDITILPVHVVELPAGILLPELLRQRCLVDIDQPPSSPETTAILHVEASNRKLRLRGFHVTVGEADAEIFEPSVSLVQSGQDNQSTQKILAEVRKFSRRNTGSLQTWLQELVQLGPAMALVIQEHAETRVPWEMVEVKDKPLGAQIGVVRWLTAKSSDGAVRLQTKRKQWTGRALSYVDTIGLSEPRKEQAALVRCEHDACADIQEFRQALCQSEVTHALLFVASHGVMARDNEHAGAFGSLEETHLQITSLDLESLDSHKGERPLAFINACHSARLWHDQYGLTGLPEVFLSKFAGAYLGTLGEVEEGLAASIGERILQAAREDPGVCIPRLLQELRAEAFHQLKPLEGPSRSRYVNTFLYVFYGSPESWLLLKPSGPPHD